MLVNVIFPFHMTGKWSDKNITEERVFGYCSSIDTDKTEDAFYATLLLFHDIFCLGLTFWAGSYMVLILYRHKQQVQHIRRTDASSRSSPESRATKFILLLGSTFVYFYILSSICQVLLAVFYQPSQFLVDITIIIAACFPAISPFLLMSRDSIVSSVCFLYMKNSVLPNLIRKM